MDSKKVGAYILARCKDKGIPMNQTKLQKLMYIVYGAYLVLENDRLCEEHPKAWPYGPVFPRVQKYFAKEGNFADVGPSLVNAEEYKSMKENDKLNEIIDNAIETFGSFTAKQLSDWSHKENSPWAKANASSNGQWNTEISDDVIKEYFQNEVMSS